VAVLPQIWDDVCYFSAFTLESGAAVNRKGAGRAMIKIGLYSEDHTLHTLLSSALGKEFEVLLQPDEDGMNVLRAAGDCDVMILSRSVLAARSA
jgi:hypothetical protein